MLLRTRLRSRGREFLADRAQRHGEVVGDRRGGAQTLDGVPSLPDRTRALAECGLQPLFRFQRAIRKHVRRALQAEHHAMKALQQRVVQLARNARPFIGTLLQARLEYGCHSTEPQLVQRPQECQDGDNYSSTKPRRLVVSGCNQEIQ
jgi:hypothetical protein